MVVYGDTLACSGCAALRRQGSQVRILSGAPTLSDTLEQIDQFDNLFPLLLHGPLPQRGVYTLPGVGTQQLSLGLGERGFGCLDLVQDVDAVPIVIEHAYQAFDLTLYFFQPPNDQITVRVFAGHIFPAPVDFIPLGGIVL